MLLCHWSDSTYTLLGHKRPFSKYAEVGIWNLDPDNYGSNPKPDPKTQNSECKFRDRDSECCPLRICIKLLRRTPSGLRTPTYVKAYATVTYLISTNIVFEWYLDQMPLSYNDEVTYEKTPDYFDRPFVPERMAQMNDSVKVISILCDPVHRAYSHFLHAFAVQDSF